MKKIINVEIINDKNVGSYELCEWRNSLARPSMVERHQRDIIHI